jgi:hypothetical protein
MKKYVSNNFKYFKNSKANSAFGHIHRLFKENKNAFPEYTKNNFGTGDLLNKYKDIYERVNERKKELKTKRLNEKSNTFVDGIFAFSLEKWEQLEKEFSQDELQKMITERMNKYMIGFKNKFGFEPIGFEMHLDEGHEKQIEAKNNNSDITLTRNIHAHVSFFNYDFKNDAAPLRNMKKKDWSKCQDLAYECFKDLGFERGISKEITNNQHLEKDAFIEEKQKQIIEKLKEKNKIIKQKDQQIKEINENGRKKIKEINEVKKIGQDFKEKAKYFETQNGKLKAYSFDLLNMNNELKNDYQEIKNDYQELSKDYTFLVKSFEKITTFLAKLGNNFFNLISLKKNKQYDEYMKEMKNLTDDFEKINNDNLLKNKDFEKIISGSISDFPDDEGVKTDLQNELKTIKLK